MVDVSVVIPALNEEDRIGGCLSSLEAQTSHRDEILVLDNGSTDETAAVASKFERVTVFDLPDEVLDGDGHFRGLAALRQHGAELANNEIIATTDADTLPPTGWLDRIKTHFDDDPDLSVVWGVVVDQNGVPVRNLTGRYLTLLGGVSGANTAFRSKAFKALKQGYVGWPMFEDVAVITRLARTGKARHDRSLVMVSDLDRTRYQTIPMLATSTATVASGALVGGPVGALAAGSGVGLGGTELVYEKAPTTSLHHDQLGLAAIITGAFVGGPVGMALGGTGSGVIAHHLLTEGLSGLPTELMEQTDVICEVPQQVDGETVTTAIECAPTTTADTSSKATRVLAGVAVGSVAGAGIAALKN